MSGRASGWDTSTQLTDEETAVLKRAAVKVVQSIFNRTTNKKDRTILLFADVPGVFTLAVAFAANLNSQKQQTKRKHAKTA